MGQVKIILVLGFSLFIAGCASVPITHRKQVNLVNEYQLMQSSQIAYNEFLSQNEVVNPFSQDALLVTRVGNKLAEGCKKFLSDYGGVNRVAGFQWEFNLVNREEINAWCMPGGKVVVYTGLLAVTQDENGLATVLSHEIAHAIARHGNERMSQQIMAQAGGSTLEAVLASTGTNANSIDLDQLIYDTYSLGSNLGSLMFSRNQESEADKMGLVFMEYAGYDCGLAVDFWKRMKAQSKGSSPVLLSTHPADAKRIADIKEFIPVAKSYVK